MYGSVNLAIYLENISTFLHKKNEDNEMGNWFFWYFLSLYDYIFVISVLNLLQVCFSSKKCWCRFSRCLFCCSSYFPVKKMIPIYLTTLLWRHARNLSPSPVSFECVYLSFLLLKCCFLIMCTQSKLYPDLIFSMFIGALGDNSCLGQAWFELNISKWAGAQP